MGIFHRKKKQTLSELQGVADGAFRCDVCQLVQPVICLCGTVIDTANGLPPKTYILCGSCALWLGFEEPRFPQGLCYNFSEEQREKVKALCGELSIANKDLENTMSLSIALASIDGEKGLGKIHELLERLPNLRELTALRYSLLPHNIIDISSSLVFHKRLYNERACQEWLWRRLSTPTV